MNLVAACVRRLKYSVSNLMEPPDVGCHSSRGSTRENVFGGILRSITAEGGRSGAPYLAEISSIRSIGRRARCKISAGSSMRGASFFMQSRTFSSVFNFMYLHSLHRQ